MPQNHPEQHGLFHITITTKARIKLCKNMTVAQTIIDNLCMTRNQHKARLYAFSVLPDHIHFLFVPGKKGLSKFIHSFKKNSTRDVCTILGDKRFKWQKGYHHRQVTNEKQRNKTLQYITYNVIRHGIAESTDEWLWTSLHFPELLDPMEAW